MHIFLCCPLANFNTSHVSINRCLYYGARRLGEISIHLMFLLIQPVPSLWHLDYHFNTSHVSINHGCKLRKWRIENMTSTEIILSAYEEIQTITGIKKKTGYSWQRIAKTLSTEGIVVNETQRIILKLYEKGLSADEIATATGYAKSTVDSYFPRCRPIYNENLSRNALRIKRCRSKKQCN